MASPPLINKGWRVEVMASTVWVHSLVASRLLIYIATFF